MATAEHPITRSELREELRLLRDEFREHYATKADLAEVRGELKALRWTMGLVGIGLSILIVTLRFLES